MKFTIMVNEGPYQHQSSDTALNFARAVLSQGHEIVRVFFYHDGVNNGTRLAVPPIDDRQLQKEWSEFGINNSVELLLCIASAQRRGLIDTDEAKRHGLDTDNILDGFTISGLGQLVEGSIESDRTIVFGD